MTTEESPAPAFAQQRLRQEALLKEYEICQQEATATANWLWASTTVFLAVWLTGLGFAAMNRERLGDWGLLAGAVIATVVIVVGWVPFVVRSFTVRQRLFMRQRQIEQGLGRGVWRNQCPRYQLQRNNQP